MLEERCFICNGRIGRGMHPPLGPNERLEKLVSVSATMNHSSTIVCDILSRILNETVMKEEIICKICFNLLNDIDYHLKEAQEKTDEVTNKYLERKNLDQGPFSANVVNIHNEEREDRLYVRSQGAGKKRQFSASGKRSHSISRRHYHNEDTDVNLTEDEMSVNTINKNKAKLLSHVLNPNKKSKLQQQQKLVKKIVPDVEDEESDEDASPPQLTKMSSKKSPSVKSKKYVPISEDDSSGDSENDENEASDVCEPVSKKSRKKSELMTVNMDDLGDLLSKPSVYFAKKSSPQKTTAVEKIVCHICNRTFKKVTNLQLHMEKVHDVNAKHPILVENVNIPDSFKCANCPREFVSEQALINHVAEEHDNDDLEASAQKPKEVQRNRAPATDNEVKATCPMCQQTFRRQYNLKIHINRVHSKVKPFKCDRCDKSFATNSDLRQHLVMHGLGKQFKCDLCDRHFNTRDSIILHKKQHNQERTHFCSVCFKGFYKASCLTRHMRSHTGERPYTCDNCDKSFSQSTTLKVHKEKCAKQTAQPV